MAAERPYIIYQLPTSKITQALSGGKIEKVWSKIENFLTSCTTADIENLRSIYMVGYSADEEHGEQPQAASEILARATTFFGDGETEPVGYLYPENIPLRQNNTEWRLEKEDLQRAINHLVKEQPLPKYNLGPLELIIAYDFNLIQPATKEELPNQQLPSSLLIWLTRNSYVSPVLCFPFAEPNVEFWNYIESIKPFIPFKLDNKYLRLVRSNKKGTANIFSKL
jgi:hypothetical protein